MSKRDDEVQKTIVACTGCGDIYVARVSPDGSVRPVGIGDCTCGEGEWDQIETKSSTG